MLQWAHLTAGILSVILLSSLLIFFLRRWCCLRRPDIEAASPIRSDNFQARISKLHQTSLIHQLDTSNIKRRGSIINHSKPGLFTWSDHPALVTDVVENGWTRFGFGTEDPHVVVTWEVSYGSVDYKQSIKFDPTANTKNPLMILRGSLPLPGPQFASSAFPQEAYFEITILQVLRGASGGDLTPVEGEKTKLFKSDGPKNIVESNQGVLSLGLAIVGSVHTRLPGQFPASIGFQSDGSVYLDGMQLVCQSEKHDWSKENKVVGCGYDPRKKKVYFTINSHLVHVINCKADEFGTPLCPILASNLETTIVINLGQSPFSYGPANGHRTPNPRLAGSGLHLSPTGLGDSKELFSIGRIDSHNLSNFFTNRGFNDESASGRTSHRRKLDYDDESDADLFEIALERSGRTNPARF